MQVGKKIDELEREKIFMPFDALKGLRDALEQKEHQKEAKVDICEEKQMELSQTLQNLKKRDFVTVTFYEDFKYKKLYGQIDGIDFPYKVLNLGGKKIDFDAILDILVE